MNINVRFVREVRLRDYEQAYVARIEEEARKYGAGLGIRVVSEPRHADLVVVVQTAEYKTFEYVLALEADPVIRDNAERLVVIDYDDHPEGLLPGIYTSIEKPFVAPERHRSWPILFINNALAYDASASALWQKPPRWLFSFIGASSNPIRSRLVELYGRDPRCHVELIDRWYNHSDGERRRFLEVAAESVFCLCPRGLASYTNRIVEVMAMGRVPVLLADDWIPFAFEGAPPYHVQVPESEVSRLPEILESYEGLASELQRNARLVWERYCSVQNRVTAALECLADIAAGTSGLGTFEQYREMWHSKSFRRKAGWTPTQQIALRVEQRVSRWFPGLRVPGVSASMRRSNVKRPDAL